VDRLPRLAAAPKLRTEDLIGMPLLTFSRRIDPHAHVRALFIAASASRESAASVSSGDPALLEEGFGLAAIPPLFVRQELERGALLQYAGTHVATAHDNRCPSARGRAAIPRWWQTTREAWLPTAATSVCVGGFAVAARACRPARGGKRR
jgi:hypothetical protein